MRSPCSTRSRSTRGYIPQGLPPRWFFDLVADPPALRAPTGAHLGIQRRIHYAPSLAELSQAGLIDPMLGSGRKATFEYELHGGRFGWHCRATPTRGSLHYLVTSDGVVRFASGRPATIHSRPWEFDR